MPVLINDGDEEARIVDADGCSECVHGHCSNAVCVCQLGFSGPNCNEAADACSEGDSCSGHGSCVDGLCVCLDAYFGARCELVSPRNCPNMCSNSGLCSQFDDSEPKCLCLYSTYGDDCSQKECEEGCEHGSCMQSSDTSLLCECEEGWTGASCSQPACPPCEHGTCEGTSCKCEPGFQGPKCDQVVCNPKCSEHGVCNGLTGDCVCYPGFLGSDCSIDGKVCPDNCSGDHGECTPAGCKCKPEWSGSSCADVYQAPCLNECSGIGVCKDGACFCPPGSGGDDCSEFLCPDECNGNGVCVDGECQCDQGVIEDITADLIQLREFVLTPLAKQHELASQRSYKGPYLGEACADRQCPSDCGVEDGRGSCDVATGLCACAPGYTGYQLRDCNVQLCDIDCSGHGGCIDGACSCDAGDAEGRGGWTGEHCEIPICPENCLEGAGHGSCHQGTCICNQLWEGVDCSTKRCPLSSLVLHLDNGLAGMLKPCSNHGICTDGICACSEGFFGDACEFRSCPNACSDHGICFADGACACFAGWGGDDCSSEVPVDSTPPCPQNCNAATERGICLQGVCRCKGMYTGEGCEVVLCPAGCDVHGTCNPDTGVCGCQPGWSGPACDVMMCNPPDCSGHGTCELNPKTKQPFCHCEGSFTGEACQLSPCDKTCSGRGRCMNDKCYCEADFRGLDCEFEKCPNQCNGHGVCKANEAADGCVCDAGWGGDGCSVSLCSGTEVELQCGGHGTCVNSKGDLDNNGIVDSTEKKTDALLELPTSADPDFICLCWDGFRGALCEDTKCDLDCSGHGECYNGECHCDKDHVGANCESELCPKACSGHGLCSDPSQPLSFSGAFKGCICDPGYEGLGCETTGPCGPKCLVGGSEGKGEGLARGSCDADTKTCLCEEGWQGKDCTEEIVCSKACLQHGTCVKGKCQCKEGFAGPDCLQVKCDFDCNHGDCLDFRCVCQKGWVGDNCDKQA